MKSLTVLKYNPSFREDWNDFISKSRNGTFLFHRNYMDYHSDRFSDHSLMVFKSRILVAVFPGNERDDVFYSHEGLTYGGLILSQMLGVKDILEIFTLINDFLKTEGFKEVLYKPVPYIYHRSPAQEDLYVLYKLKAERIGCHVSSVIKNAEKLGFKESRKSGLRKAVRLGVSIGSNEKFEEFWLLLTNNLQKTYRIYPVHSLDEIRYLKSRFPDQIKLHIAELDGKVIAGVITYVMSTVAHVQYISANQTGRETGALDLIFNHLLEERYSDLEYFDFGSSTEHMGKILNENLIFQKEGFGGRGVVYETYKYIL